jgi:nitroreductase
MFRDLVLKNRSYRRFDAAVAVDRDTLIELVDLARQTPSTGNQQPLKYFLSTDAETNAIIYHNVTWAGYLTDWPGPAEEERPGAYIVILRDNQISRADSPDIGIAAQTIMLGAAEKGLGGCMFASMKKGLREALGIPEQFEIVLALAIGKPAEEVVLEPVGPTGSIRYHRDAAGVHYVPKRSLEDIIVG